MPININTSNYINTQQTGPNNGSAVSSAAQNVGDGVVISVKGANLQVGQTLSGQVVEVNGKDIKLLLGDNQTISAKLEGNINALLGQTLSFEVKTSENGQTALRPLYTNLNNSPAVSNALTNAGLPHTENYMRMVSSMMDEGMPINKNALYDMSRQVNSFPGANPETIVQLNKLGLQVNELTISQYENYKGLEHQIISDVDNLSKGLTDLMKESLEPLTGNVADVASEATLGMSEGAKEAMPKQSLLSAFFNAITGNDNKPENANQAVGTETQVAASVGEESETAPLEEKLEEKEANANLDADKQKIETFNGNNSATVDLVGEEASSNIKADSNNIFDTSKAVLDMVDTESDVDDSAKMPTQLKQIVNELRNELNENGTQVKSSVDTLSDEATVRDAIKFAKSVIEDMAAMPEKYPESIKKKAAQLLTEKTFSQAVKEGISKQMLLKPEDVVSSKNVEELYSKITKSANQAMEILQGSGKDNSELAAAAKNINDNVNFMNELNQVVTYVQLPLLLNNKSAHGDLYVYTNKKSLKNNDGNVSALLHLDMDNLGPMDVYVALSNGKKLNTHFYLQDDATIDFIADHIDILNKRLEAKGYNTSMEMTVKDNSKGPTNIAKEFMKDDPNEEGVHVSKISFDVRA